MACDFGHPSHVQGFFNVHHFKGPHSHSFRSSQEVFHNGGTGPEAERTDRDRVGVRGYQGCGVGGSRGEVLDDKLKGDHCLQ